MTLAFPEFSTSLVKPSPQPATPPLRYGMLERILAHAAPFPNDTLLFGMGEDGFPLILELNDPGAGTFALIGDRDSGLRNLMRVLLYSLVYLNAPEHAAFYAIGVETLWLDDYIGYAHCLGVERAYYHAARELILHLVSVCEARRAGRHPGPHVVLLLDDFRALLARFDGETQNDLRYLMQAGPAQGIWPIASIHSEDIGHLWYDWQTVWRTRILGHIADERIARKLDVDGLPRAAYLQPGREFGTRVQRRWLRFAIPAFYEHELRA
ncbi:MAG: hypothetical protein D6755_12180 [Anaerolineae bacterium]|nr:MAG: hypothetical protein D6755_12180 [Anaerolineae bacterium]